MGVNLDELERLYKAATPGEWRLQDASHGGKLLLRGEPVGKDMHLQSHLQVAPAQDAELIAALHKAFPALLALARDGERHRERIRALQAEGKTGDLRIGLSIDEHQIAVRLTALSLDREADPLRRVMMETGELYAELRAAIDAARKGERNGNS